jgi:hypothetical protein
VGRSASEILELFEQRKRSHGPVIARMAELKEHYNNDVVLPLPELVDQGEKAAVANLINMGVDQLGMRIASTMPDIRYLPTKPGKEASEERARKRRLATLGWWEENELNIKMRRRARWLIAYGSAPVVIRPDYKRQLPKWHLRDPLTTYPAPTEDPDDMCPDDVIFSYKRTAGWLREMYGEKLGRLRAPRAPRDQKYQILEYMDAEEIVLLVTGEADTDHTRATGLPASSAVVELDRIPNKCGYCPAVVPGRVTLDQPMGQFDAMTGLYQQQALLMALEVHAVKKGVFPDTWLIARPNEQPDIIEAASGIDGIVGVVKGGDLKWVNEQPGYQTFPTIDRLERAQRLSGGIPSELGGEAASNIRTDRRGQSIMSAVIDFPVQEAQNVFARSLKWETKLAIATDKANWGDTPKSFFVSWMGAKGQVDYTPNKDFENDFCFISYSFAGTDANGLMITLGQAMASELLSTRSAQELHPLVDDPEEEHDRILSEGLERALMSSLQTQVADPNSPWQPMDVARVMMLVKSNQLELAEAITKVQEEKQAAQATPVPPDDPAAQPGLAPPGMGAEQPSEAAGPPPLQDLLARLTSGQQEQTSLLGAMRLGQRTTPAEEALA